MGRGALVWGGVAAAVGVPVALAAGSELLAWRGPVYVAGGFAGIAALSIVLVQPLLIGGHLAGVPGRRGHVWLGGALVVAVLVHVGALWLTSPPDMMDALMLASPTPFSVFGVVAMWAVFGVAVLAGFRRRLALRARTWRLAHMALAVVIVGGGVVHALLIEGAMETVSKAVLCGLAVVATVVVMAERRVWRWRAAARASPRG